MGRVGAFCQSLVGKKVIMAVTGIILFLFVVGRHVERWNCEPVPRQAPVKDQTSGSRRMIGVRADTRSRRALHSNLRNVLRELDIEGYDGRFKICFS
jgi:hypothetical protein